MRVTARSRCRDECVGTATRLTAGTRPTVKWSAALIMTVGIGILVCVAGCEKNS